MVSNIDRVIWNKLLVNDNFETLRNVALEKHI